MQLGLPRCKSLSGKMYNCFPFFNLYDLCFTIIYFEANFFVWKKKSLFYYIKFIIWKKNFLHLCKKTPFSEKKHDLTIVIIVYYYIQSYKYIKGCLILWKSKGFFHIKLYLINFFIIFIDWFLIFLLVFFSQDIGFKPTVSKCLLKHLHS